MQCLKHLSITNLTFLFLSFATSFESDSSLRKLLALVALAYTPDLQFKTPQNSSVSLKAANMSNSDDSNTLKLITPTFTPSSTSSTESAGVASIIKSLSLIEHVEGGYFAVTDVSDTFIPSPYPEEPLSQRTIDLVNGLPADYDPSKRRLSTTIFYYLTPNRPMGSFHRNRSRIIHSLHRGRGRYVLIHPDGRIESFVVGHNVERGEKLQWIVEGGAWKASFLLADDDGQSNSDGLLISETVVPGFEYADHEFLSQERLVEILPETKAKALQWLVKH